VGIALFVIWLQHWIGYVVLAILLVLFAVTLGWAWRRVNSSQRVVSILQGAEGNDAESRRAALEKLDRTFKKNDVNAALARAQLLAQSDPDQALAALENVNLSKILPVEADQIRCQRAMFHLAKGDVDQARKLVDPVDLSRFHETKTRAAAAAILAEAWARTGQGPKANSTLDILNPDDPALAEVRAQLWRARAFAAAAVQDRKAMVRALKKMCSENPHLLAGFMTKRVHPLLEKEARQMLVQQGVIRPKVQFQRH